MRAPDAGLFERHSAAVLQFSGGKDSLACLHLLRPYWDRLTVLWANTGDAFPETVEQMRDIADLVPHFQEVRSQQPENIKRFGPPADVLSAWDTPYGRMIDDSRRYRVQTPFGCCAVNIWKPLDEATRALRATLVIRGQRHAESKKAPIRSGHVEDGIEYYFPIEDWTDQEVVEYLRANDVKLPEHYAYVDSSLDCQTCTAYLAENAGKFVYVRERHPHLHAELRQRLSYIRDAAMTELTNAIACGGLSEAGLSMSR